MWFFRLWARQYLRLWMNPMEEGFARKGLNILTVAYILSGTSICYLAYKKHKEAVEKGEDFVDTSKAHMYARRLGLGMQGETKIVKIGWNGVDIQEFDAYEYSKELQQNMAENKKKYEEKNKVVSELES